MAHPQEVSVEQRMKKEHLSPLMRAKSKAKQGEKINACPFGCDVKNLDDHGYCRHLIGFTNDGKTYEPMIRRGGKRRVEVKMEIDPEESLGEDGEPLKRPVLEKVLPTDKLVKISISSRVYRDVDGLGAKLEAKRQAEEAEKRAEERRLLIEEIKSDPAARAALLDALSAPSEGELITVGSGENA